eukprot:1649216-Amphidinium_carterae.1
MYRALSPSAEAEDVSMDVSTPQGTGGLSPPPPAVGARLDRPLGAALLAAGVVAAEELRTAESTVALGAGGEAPDTVRGRQPGHIVKPARTSALAMLGAGAPARRSRSRAGRVSCTYLHWPGAGRVTRLMMVLLTLFGRHCTVLPWPSLARSHSLHHGEAGGECDGCSAC